MTERNAGIVNEHVEFTERAHGVAHHAPPTFLVGDVESHELGLFASREDLVDDSRALNL